MSSFDVCNLFTNVPLDETISIILNSLFANTSTVEGLNKKQFKNLLDIATKDILFLFKDKLYKQVDGVAMGSPLGPTLANIFMSHFERLWLRDCPAEFRPLHYSRYVDDTFVLFRSRDHISKFHEYLNSQHPNIKFTCDIEQDDSLPFLDTLVKRSTDTGRFITSVYRKPTYTGLSLQYDSLVPHKYKFNLVQTLVTRAFRISSNYFILCDEIDFIKDNLRKNGFPNHILERAVKKTLDGIFIKKDPYLTVPKDSIYLCLPYIGPPSHTLARKLSHVINTNYNTVHLKPVFTASRKIGSFFHYKDKMSVPLCSSVIYQYACGSCSVSYVGKTLRNLSIRTDEHKGVSFRTKFRLSKPMFSSIREHSENCDHLILNQNFTILDFATNDFDLCILENIWIWKLRPQLNEYGSSASVEILK